MISSLNLDRSDGRASLSEVIVLFSMCLIAAVGGCDKESPTAPTQPDQPTTLPAIHLSVASCTESSLTLRWEVPYVSPTGDSISIYDIRYSKQQITDQNWSSAQGRVDTLTPKPSKAVEMYTLTNLEAGTEYYFSAKFSLNGKNWSQMSPTVSERTLRPGERLIAADRSLITRGAASTSDGGLMILATANSRGNSIFEPLADSSTAYIYLAKMDARRQTVWTKRLSSSTAAFGGTIAATSDGAFMISGYSSGSYFVQKIDADGNDLWRRSVSGMANAVCAADQGGCIISGTNSSLATFVTALSSTGDLLWERIYDGDFYGGVSGVMALADGSAVAVSRFDGFCFLGDCFPGRAFLLKVGPGGDSLWCRTFEDTESTAFSPDCITADGADGFLLAGHRLSGGQTVTAVVMRCDSLGATIWTRQILEGRLEMRSLARVDDGGCIMAGSQNFSLDAIPRTDVCIIRTNRDGYRIGSATLGGEGNDEAATILTRIGGGYTIVGSTTSFGYQGKIYVVDLAPGEFGL